MINKALLKPEVQAFIAENLKIDITKLILKGSQFKDISVKELANQINGKRKSEKKLPTWFNNSNIIYPPKISIEQTSSEITAQYKTTLTSGETLIDITGGFGVDCFKFSKAFKRITHCEINTDLSKITEHNFKELAVNNCNFIAENGIEYLQSTQQKFDCIYIDPSRRNDIKGKVFLLNDCLPNVPENLDFLFYKSQQILIKNSPMLDISKTVSELKFVKEIHVVAIENDVKELLFLLEKNYVSSIEVNTINFAKNKTQYFNFNYNSLATSKYAEPLTYLYEPNAAILKSGAFHQVSETYNLFKLEENSHLYTSDALIEFPGRVFKVEKYFKYNSKKIKQEIKGRKANITVRNFVKTVAQIRKETKLKDGGEHYVFISTSKEMKGICIICKKN